MAPRTPLLEPTWPHNPPLGTNMAPGAPNLEPRWAQDPSTWPQLGPNPPKFKPKSIQKCATLSCRILAHNANMKCQTKLPKQMPSQTAKTQEGGGDSRSVRNIYIYIYIYIYISSMRLKRKGVSWDNGNEKCSFGCLTLGTPTTFSRIPRISPEGSQGSVF